MKKVSKLTYIFSVFTWIANIVLIFVNIFLDLFAFSLIFLFASVLLQGFLSGVFWSSDSLPDNSVQKTRFDTVLLIFEIVSAIFWGVGFIFLMTSGGNPEVIGGEYCIMNHGEIVSTISKNTFILLSVCEYFVLYFGMLFFTTFMLSTVRARFLMQISVK